MKNFTLLFLVFLFLSACAGKKEMPDQWAGLKSYIAEVNAPQALDTLVAEIRKSGSPENTPELAMLIASVLEEKMKDSISAIALYQALETGFPDTEAAKTAKSRIPKGAPELKKQIESLQASIFDPRKMTLDSIAISQYLNICTIQALLLPNDPQSEYYLHKAAENAYYTQQFPRALFLYEWFEQAYPQSDKAGQAMFMRAFILDNDLQRFEAARELYLAFLEKYPGDDFADDARALLDNLGKSPEEVIKSWNQ